MSEAAAKLPILKSMMQGISGATKGALAGGSVGILGGGLAGAATGWLTIGTMPGAVAGALIAGILFSIIGSMAGSMTEVVRGREIYRMQAETANPGARVARPYNRQQGLAKGLSQQAAHEQADTKWQDKQAEELAAKEIETARER